MRGTRKGAGPASGKDQEAPAAAAQIEAYLASLPAEQRAALQRLRETIRAAVPEATEAVSYGIPLVKLGGRGLVGYNASASHCTFQLMSTTVLEQHAAEVKRLGYRTGKGSIQFTPDKPLPEALVRTLVAARVAENGATAAEKQPR